MNTLQKEPKKARCSAIYRKKLENLDDKDCLEIGDLFDPKADGKIGISSSYPLALKTILLRAEHKAEVLYD